MSSKLPIVAIIGRANAGKSSLFNRLVRAKQAIVAKEAGTTRNKVVGKVDYQGSQFWLIDTAGLKDPSDEFEQSIQDQIEEAVDSADVILVVVDSTNFTSDEDRNIAKKALRSKKPVILVANKTDLASTLPNDEFKRLGISDIIRISAEHNVGISTLLENIGKIIPKSTELSPEKLLKICLVGRPNVGKSYLFNSLLGKQQAIVADVAGTTRDVNKTLVKYHGKDIEFIDTAGMRKPGKQEVGIEKFSVLRTLSAIEESDICLLLMDVNQLNTQLDQRIAGIVDEAGKGLIIVVTKWDSVEGKDAFTRDALAPKIASTFNFVPYAPLIFTSSLTGQNISKIYDLVMKVEESRLTEIKTRELNTLLQELVGSHPPAALKNHKPKLRYIVQTDTAPPWFVIYGSHLKFLHWSYKRYIEKNLRENFDLTGTPIRFSFRDEDQIKANRSRIKQGKKPRIIKGKL